jgi:hypothetical protein
MAFVLTLAVTRGWRARSEVLRANYRGNSSISTYHVMGIAAIAFAGIHSYFTTDHVGVTADLAVGTEALWHAEVLLALQTLWALVFVMFGKSDRRANLFSSARRSHLIAGLNGNFPLARTGGTNQPSES